MYKILTLLLLISLTVKSQDVPKVYSNISKENGKLILQTQEGKIQSAEENARYKYSGIVVNPESTERGLKFKFDKKINGTLFYGFIKYGDGKYNYPVYFKKPARIIDGVAEIDIKRLSGKYDMISWEQYGKGTIGYRIMSSDGYIIYDGTINFKGTGPFRPAPTIIEGPFVSNLTHKSANIWFKTNYKVKTRIECNSYEWKDDSASYFHNFKINNLDAGKSYSYTIYCDDFTYEYKFKTAPLPGSETEFTFAYASDSRVGQGGGERNIYGVNSYILKRIMAYASKENVAFIQFSGDLINGYTNSVDEFNLELANWKKTIEPFAHYIPVYVAPGNHESLSEDFFIPNKHYPIAVDKFPFETESAEAVFANNFVLPENGPESEDGSYLDPSKETTDFPPYKETVYSYEYANTAVIVLNSNYWYTTDANKASLTSGNVHAYIMPVQMQWLEQKLEQYENNSNIKNIFVTIHTPAFPNGGHSHNDMWYKGNNNIRAYVAGKPAEKGIIENRDKFLDLLVNKSSKVVAMLTGDEHNYCKLLINDKMKRYPEGYDKPKQKLNRSIYQINNGAAGAPYYAQEILPWSEYTSGFTTQNAVVLVTVKGEHVKVRVVNPDTLELIEEYTIK